MKNLLTFSFALFVLTFISCTKEEITSSDPVQEIILDTNPINVNASVDQPVEGSGFGSISNGGNTSTNVTQKHVLEFLANESDVSTFYNAIVKTGMNSEISGDGPYTIFAPTNEAFESFLANNNWDSINDVSTSTLTAIVKFHISETAVNIGKLTFDTPVPTLFNNQELYIHIDASPAYLTLGLTNANLIEMDLEQSNGMVNKISSVLSL